MDKEKGEELHLGHARLKFKEEWGWINKTQEGGREKTKGTESKEGGDVEPGVKAVFCQRREVGAATLAHVLFLSHGVSFQIRSLWQRAAERDQLHRCSPAPNIKRHTASDPGGARYPSRHCD